MAKSYHYAMERLGLRALQRLVEAAPRENHLLSPLALGQGLLLASYRAGAAGRAALLETLGIEASRADEVGQEARRVLNMIASGKLTVAHALWTPAGATPSPDLIQRARLDFQSDARPWPATGAPAALDAWVARATAGAQKNFPAGRKLVSPARLVLTGAVFARPVWSYPLSARDTRPGAFRTAGGGAATVPMMRHHAAFGYVRRHTHTALMMTADRFDVTLLAPEGRTAAQLLAGIAMSEWRDRALRTTAMRVQLTLPRLALSEGADLRPALSTKDAGPILEEARAGIAAILQQVTLRLEEESRYKDGSPARMGGGAMGVSAGLSSPEASSPPSRPRGFFPNIEGQAAGVKVTIDRPFLLAIQERFTGAPIVIGYVARPA